MTERKRDEIKERNTDKEKVRQEQRETEEIIPVLPWG